VQAIRNALAAKPNGMITGEDVKEGLEHVKGFTLGGLVPPIEITPENHEGGGWVQIWQVKGGKLARVTDWFKAYPDVIAAHLKEAGTMPHPANTAHLAHTGSIARSPTVGARRCPSVIIWPFRLRSSPR
jgi:hypothetical protein